MDQHAFELPAKTRMVVRQSPFGLYVGGYDTFIDKDISVTVTQEPAVLLGLMLSGQSTSIALDGVGKFDIPVGRPTVLSFLEPTECTSSYAAGEHCAGIAVSLTQAFFDHHKDHPSAAALVPLQELLNRPSDIEVLHQSVDIAKLATELLAIDETHPTAALRLEGIGLNMISMFCRALDDARVDPQQGDLSAAAFKRVRIVTNYLNENIAETPSLADLAKLAGINQTTLTDEFKLSEGETIFAWLRNKRLEAARAILRSEDASVTDTSFRVGYASTTSFTTAYRRRFGYPPSQETLAVFKQQ